MQIPLHRSLEFSAEINTFRSTTLLYLFHKSALICPKNNTIQELRDERNAIWLFLILIKKYICDKIYIHKKL